MEGGCGQTLAATLDVCTKLTVDTDLGHCCTAHAVHSCSQSVRATDIVRRSIFSGIWCPSWDSWCRWLKTVEFNGRQRWMTWCWQDNHGFGVWELDILSLWTFIYSFSFVLKRSRGCDLMRYSPKLQTEGDPTVPPGTKEMKEFKFIQAKICTESCASESPPFQPQPLFLIFFLPPRILATLVVPFARARGLQFGLSLILRFFYWFIATRSMISVS